MGGRDGGRDTEAMEEAFFEAQMAFLGLAIGNAAEIAMNLFRYRSSSTYYSNGDTAMDTNWWKLASQTMNYVSLGVWGLAALTQLFSVLGFAADINLLVWMYVVFLLGGLATGLTGAFYSLAYDKAYEESNDTSNSASVISAASSVFSAVW